MSGRALYFTTQHRRLTTAESMLLLSRTATGGELDAIGAWFQLQRWSVAHVPHGAVAPLGVKRLTFDAQRETDERFRERIENKFARWEQMGLNR